MKKRFLFLIHSLNVGGAERATSSIASYLADKGHKITIATMASKNNDFFSLNKDIKRVEFGLQRNTRWFNKIFFFYLRVKAAHSAIKSQNPDVVIGMMTTSNVLAIISTIGKKSKVVISERNYPPLNKIPFLWNILRKWLYRFSDAQVCQTKEIETWIKYNTKSKKTHIIPNSVKWPIPSTHPIKEPITLIPGDKNIILAVGSITYQKGFDLLIKAFSLFEKDYPSWILVILGKENKNNTAVRYKNELLDLITKHSLSSSVFFPGEVGNITDWYLRAKIFVLSSRYEGFPNVLLEAMAAGCPSVAFDCKTGPRELIKHKENGTLVQSGDIEALAKAVKELIDDKELQKKYQNNAVLTKKIFSETRILNQWETLLENV